MKQIAILGPSASNKSKLSMQIAKNHNGIILSLDSISAYKHIDIASAKPSKDEIKAIRHFGINLIKPNKDFNVCDFAKEYKKARVYAKEHNKNLIICGGSSFWLKAMIDGVCDTRVDEQKIKATSQKKSKQVKKINSKIQNLLKDKAKAYKFLYEYDKKYAKKISQNDTYRISRALEIIFTHNQKPSCFFKNISQNTSSKTISNTLADMQIFIINTPLNEVADNIKKRTKRMLSIGLLDEVCHLSNHYNLGLKSMQSIGIKEVLSYFDGEIKTTDELIEKITQNTRALAKRQITFNKSQFNNYANKPIFGSPNYLLNSIKEYLKNKL